MSDIIITTGNQIPGKKLPKFLGLPKVAQSGQETSEEILALDLRVLSVERLKRIQR